MPRRVGVRDTGDTESRNETLFDVVAWLARRRSATTLVIFSLVGAGTATPLLLFQPTFLPVSLAGIGFATFGLWGLLDRALETAGGTHTSRAGVLAVSALKFLVAALGFLAATGAIASIGYMFLGGWAPNG